MGEVGLPASPAPAAGLTMLSGLALYMRDSGGLQWAWISSGQGTAFTIGALAAILGAILGFGVTAPAAARMAGLAQRLQVAGGAPPAADQAAELAVLQARVGLLTRITALLLVVAAAAMATARYWY